MTTWTNSEPPPETAVEERLRAFFRQEMRAVSGQWSEASDTDKAHRMPPTSEHIPLTSNSSPLTTRHSPIRESRFALAASLLALVTGAGIVATQTRSATSPPAPLPGDVIGPKAEMPGKSRRVPAHLQPSKPAEASPKATGAPR